MEGAQEITADDAAEDLAMPEATPEATPETAPLETMEEQDQAPVQ
jgi:hypothetical protein